MNVLAMEDAERRCCVFSNARYVYSGGTRLSIWPVGTPLFTKQVAVPLGPATL